ncbi:hypothetical protein QWZ08_00680 [Ferruginibacter paludis]|uniref:hypothetical protein n=1 Tax=Ferruginibacter paludis TaxID=1310417 RepID=UPI0025B580A6|nr:hypothetical protein [Ferruginibacter paludis]MDN3654117.1 hypothetical protein [Ferruginibacter paludis]
MTLYAFNILGETQKHKVLKKYGVEVAERKMDGFHIVLYQLFSFYVELYYHAETDILERLMCFSDTAYLDPYLNFPL